jgi:IS5 family transposase
LHGNEAFIFVEAGYWCAEKRSELQEVQVDWYIAEWLGRRVNSRNTQESAS